MSVNLNSVMESVQNQRDIAIRLESIGGLGANLAGKMLAEAGVLQMGLNGFSAASYGSEKKGTPVKAFVRLTQPEVNIRSNNPIEEPDMVGVFHEALLKTHNCIAGMQPDGILVVNTARTPEEIRQASGLKTGTVVCVDATGIAIEEKTRVNTAMMGALCEEAAILNPDAVCTVIRNTFNDRYPASTEANIRTFHRGYSEVVKKTYPVSDTSEVVPFVRPISEVGYATQPMGAVIETAGNSFVKDMSASRQGFIPAFNADKICIHCGNCDLVCPDMCFVWKSKTNENGKSFMYLEGIDYQYCKGCLKCVEACPTFVLEKIRETEAYVAEHTVSHPFHVAAN